MRFKRLTQGNCKPAHVQDSAISATAAVTGAVTLGNALFPANQHSEWSAAPGGLNAYLLDHRKHQQYVYSAKCPHIWVHERRVHGGGLRTQRPLPSWL